MSSDLTMRFSPPIINTWHIDICPRYRYVKRQSCKRNLLCRKTEQASPSAFMAKWLEHLASVQAKKFLAPNCNLFNLIFIRSN